MPRNDFRYAIILSIAVISINHMNSIVTSMKNSIIESYIAEDHERDPLPNTPLTDSKMRDTSGFREMLVGWEVCFMLAVIIPMV